MADELFNFLSDLGALPIKAMRRNWVFISLQIQTISNPELNANNPDVIQQAVKVTKQSNFLRLLARQYN